MAEVLAPLSFCTGSLGFILSTVPALSKTHQSYLQRHEQLRGYKLRVESCEARVRVVDRFEKGSKDYEGIIAAKDDIEKLRGKILEALRKYDAVPKIQKLGGSGSRMSVANVPSSQEVGYLTSPGRFCTLS
jgi:hypothetical protein